MSHYDEYRPNRKLFGLSVSWLAFGAALIAVALLASYLLGWFAKPLQMTAPDNLKRLSREANDAYQALDAKLASITAIETKAESMTTAYGEDMTKWPQGKRDEYLQLQAQVTNLVTSYNTQCGQYNGFWNDEWRALPAPKDIPQKCEMR